MMVASLVLPAVLFAYASWLNYRHEYEIADDRIDRSLDILHEHTLKVFQTVERAIAEVDEIVRDMADDAIRAKQDDMHERLRQIVDALPQVRAIFIVDREGEPLVSSQFAPIPPEFNASDRNYFRVHVTGHAGIYVSDIITPRQANFGAPFFILSRRRPSADGSFKGVTAVSVLPQYFEEFYAVLGRNQGSLFALVRDDGKFLAHYPPLPDRQRALQPGSGLHRAISAGWERVIYTVPQSQLDGAERRIGYRKLEGFPVYLVTGIDASAIRGVWLTNMGSHLIFGVPATFGLFLILGIALRRTRRLHGEAERRESAENALRQSQRLEAIGKLTGGVAHDFNNLLMAVLGNLEILRKYIPDNPKLRRLIDGAIQGAERGATLTKRMLAFSRRQTLAPRWSTSPITCRAQGHACAVAERRYRHRRGRSG
jgi:two-component system NtrC family sensor kinase